MQINEVFETINITHDDKARRVLNTCPDKVADITLEEIEKGITIERLSELTVPVYRYGGQVTIHGIFEGIPDDLRVHGYKSVFHNGNKSLGVKYVAIDSYKKNLLQQVSHYADKGNWGIHIDSQGCEAIRIFHSNDRDDDIKRLKECFNSTPDNLYIGNKRWASLMWGGFAVIIYIGAIYETNLWDLIKAFTGLSHAEYKARFDERELKYKIERETDEAEEKAEAEAKAIKLQHAKSNFIVPSNWMPFNGKPTEPGTYAHIRDTWADGIALEVVKVAKRGAFLCDTSKSFPDFKYVDWNASGYRKGMRNINGWRITDKPVKTATVSVKADVKPQPDIVISHNDKLNGIEIKFANKPTDDILCKLKSFGFRWSYKSMLWYNRYSAELWDTINSNLRTV